MANVTFNEDRCKGCALCVGACPKGIVAMSTTKISPKGVYIAEVTDMDKCIGCAFCATMCPDCAIMVEK